ncbi:hypothetical protein Syun_011629 [Stephania yunnanensis]|uniref:Uncharacterized protein n=1 Tax=Stephania yunnanensis TaxID=152371 RepID=A0AAP0JYM2_9MAGN
MKVGRYQTGRHSSRRRFRRAGGAGSTTADLWSATGTAVDLAANGSSSGSGGSDLARAVRLMQTGGFEQEQWNWENVLAGGSGGGARLAGGRLGSCDDDEVGGDLADGGRPAGGRSGGRWRTGADLVMACADQVAAGGRSGMAAEDREQSVPAAGRWP